MTLVVSDFFGAADETCEFSLLKGQHFSGGLPVNKQELAFPADSFVELEPGQAAFLLVSASAAVAN